MAYVLLSDLEAAMARRFPHGLGQAPAGGIEVVADERLVPWLTDPDKAPEAEASGLLLSLSELKDASTQFAQEVQPVVQAIDGWKARIEQQRHVLAALRQATQSGMSDLDLEFMIASDQGMGFSLRKVFRSIEKAVVDPIKKIGKQIDKNVFQPVNENVFKPLDKAVFRPVGDAIEEAGRAIDKAVFRPITSSHFFETNIKNPLKKFEKYTLRPAGDEIQKGIAFLDKHVPGWATVLDFIMPVPFISTVVGQTTKLIVKDQVVQRLVGTVVPKTGSSLADEVVKAAADKAIAVAVPVAESAASVASQPFVRQFSFTITKGTHTFLSTKGDLWTKIQATALEALNGFALAVQLAATAVSGGALAPTVQVLNALLSALKSGITVLKTMEAAELMKEQARAIRDAAAAEAARLAEEDRILSEEIRRLQEQIENIKRMREQLAAQQPGRPQATLPVVYEEEDDDETEVDEGGLLAGTIFAVGGLILLAVAIRKRRERRRTKRKKK